MKAVGRAGRAEREKEKESLMMMMIKQAAKAVANNDTASWWLRPERARDCNAVGSHLAHRPLTRLLLKIDSGGNILLLSDKSESE